jgi:DNA repair exonuclease SbcCD nuclease subunit
LSVHRCLNTHRGRTLTTFRFVHAADLHIDSPFRGLRDVDERVAGRLQSATYDAFQNLVKLCIEEQAAFLLIAGDIYDAEDRGVRAQVRFREGLAELADHGIETFVVHGNHDPLDGWRSALAWPRGVHIFKAEPEWKVAHLATPSAGEAAGIPVAAIQGMSYPTREVTENLARKFAPPPGRDLFTIGLLHCNVGGNPDHPDYAPCTVQDLAQTGIDYWALGHVHSRQTLRDARRSGLPHITYPGNTQGRHPNEPGARGCLLVEVGQDRIPRTEFRPLDVVRWETAQVNITGLKTLDALHGAVRQAMDDLSARAEGRDVVCRIRLTGRGPMHQELRRDSALDELLAMTRADAGSASPWVWVERMTDGTRPDLDLAARARQDDFLGAALRRGAAESSTPEGMSELSGLLAEVYSGRRNGLEAPAAAQVAMLAEEARWKLAELLEPEE